ncbi:MAG: DUF4394 domain-containing protein [Nostoc desertorum CM1-VF14]|jgi:hypothetical protein|nr:DUF4394 domain-containing protein [Nostoc desertorum CM1-VF14]
MTTAYVLSNNTLISFDTSNPDNLNANIPITGLVAGQNLVGIDFRPQNGKLYGIASDGMGNAQLYAISIQTGLAVAIGTLGQFVDGVGNPVPITGPDFGIDFNPTVDRLRIVTSNGLNFRVNPNTGAAIDGNSSIMGVNPDGLINGGTTTVNATAYTNSAPNVTTTTQYTLDSVSNTLFIQNPPNNGTQTSPLVVTLNGTPLDFTSVNGFDIPSGVNVSASNTPATGQAFAVLTVGSTTGLYAIELSTGAATLIGTVGAGTDPVQGFALQNEVVSAGIPLIGLTADGTQLLRFNSASSGTVTTAAITGVTAGEILVGIDLRPATGQLYGLAINDAANTGTLYLIDPQTGTNATATIVGGSAGQIALVDATGNPVDLPPANTGFGFDFNPTADRIRVVTSTGLNFRLNPITGLAVDANTGVTGINPDGVINALPVGSTGISATAYTNSFNGTTATTQYTLDPTSNSLFIQNLPNNGTQTVQLSVTINGAPLDFTEASGFDIPSNVRVTASNAAASGRGVAALSVGGVTNLYAIELGTGAATLLGPIGTSLAGLTVAESPTGTVAFGKPTYNVAENDTAIALDLIRTGGSSGAFTVDLAATGGTATAGFDYNGTPVTVTFADGQTTATATLNITDDSLAEGNEAVTLSLKNPTNGAVLAAQDTAIFNIADNDNGGNITIDDGGITINNGGTIATNFAANGSAIISIANKFQSFVQFSLSSRKNTFANEIVAFTVDDDLGTINGVAPNATGYLEAAIARSRTIFATLSNNPNGFGGELSSILDFGSNARFSTLLIQNGSLDELRAGKISANSVFLSSQTSVRISSATSSNFTFGFEDSPNSGNNDFNDIVLDVKTVSQSASAGSVLQGQSEVLDLRSLTGQVSTLFTVNREAAFDNLVGFYRVVDQNGGIDTNGDGTVDILPGGTGYAQAAVNNYITGIDLSVKNQQTATLSGQFVGGSIFAPFLIANASVNEVVNGQKLDQVYFAYLGANSDQADHIRLLGNNTFGFEDLRGGGDKDFNDLIVRVTI